MSGPTLHRGALARHPRILSVRSLTREDLPKLKAPRVGPPRIKSFRETHHRLARMIAAGFRDHEICRKTGFSQSRIGSLRQDPAFQQLVSEYRDKVTESWTETVDEFHETSISNMLRAERMIEDHLDAADETDERIPLPRLLAITSDRADRFGYGKHRTQRNENISFAEEMKTIAQRSGKSNVIDSQATLVKETKSAPAALGEPVHDRVVEGFRRRA